jgi:hypothetical protein
MQEHLLGRPSRRASADCVDDGSMLLDRQSGILRQADCLKPALAGESDQARTDAQKQRVVRGLMHEPVQDSIMFDECVGAALGGRATVKLTPQQIQLDLGRPLSRQRSRARFDDTPDLKEREIAEESMARMSWSGSASNSGSREVT